MPSPTLKWPKLAKNPLPMVPLPHAFQQLLKMGGDWESGLCNCTPLSSCILGTFLPCFRTWVMLKRTEIGTRFAIRATRARITAWPTGVRVAPSSNMTTKSRKRMPDPQTIISEQPQLAEAMSLAPAGLP
ncbi:hypothetical protein F5X96DRAFT_667487 [Biscogniauxia mediterranea]|nr:hypothetical protein F5X96DRAFT_667487 [Biscogniauxia mediterranea]